MLTHRKICSNLQNFTLKRFLKYFVDNTYEFVDFLFQVKFLWNVRFFACIFTWFFFKVISMYMGSTMVEIILEIEFQCSYDFYLQGFSWILFFYRNLKFWEIRENKVVRMNLQKNKYLIWNPLPTLYMQYLFGLKYDRQLTAW